MNYTAALCYLNYLPNYQINGRMALKKMGLERIFALCAALGHPQKKIKAIHIAGTNGKGSTAHALAAVLQAAGYTTGLYTSPHFKDFRERIRINGKPISKTYVAQFVTRHAPIYLVVGQIIEITKGSCVVHDIKFWNGFEKFLGMCLGYISSLSPSEFFKSLKMSL